MDIILQNKGDIMRLLAKTRSDIDKIRTKHFDFKPITKESWDLSPTALIGYGKDKIPMLKAAGVMKDPRDYEYGWFRSNENNANVSNALTDADKLLVEILNYLDDYILYPKSRRYTRTELSRFEVIIGGGLDSYLLSQLKEGASNV